MNNQVTGNKNITGKFSLDHREEVGGMHRSVKRQQQFHTLWHKDTVVVPILLKADTGNY